MKYLILKHPLVSLCHYCLTNAVINGLLFFISDCHIPKCGRYYVCDLDLHIFTSVWMVFKRKWNKTVAIIFTKCFWLSLLKGGSYCPDIMMEIFEFSQPEHQIMTNLWGNTCHFKSQGDNVTQLAVPCGMKDGWWSTDHVYSNIMIASR